MARTRRSTALNHLLDREALLKASKLRQKEVSIPGVGIVLVRELSAKQRLEYIEYMELDKDNKPQLSQAKQVDFNKFIVSLSVINEDGSRLFKSIEDVPDMRQDVMTAIVKAVLVLSEIVTDGVLENKPSPLAEKKNSDMP